MDERTGCDMSEDPLLWKKNKIQVAIRIRALNTGEISQGHSECFKKDKDSCPKSVIWIGHPEACFTFDLVADKHVSQEKLFKVAGLPMVDNCMAGYNSCIFAYGQTGSGKTYTMHGDIKNGTIANRGMTPRVFDDLFCKIQKEEEIRNGEKLQFMCKCSFLEIYNEQIFDLLDPRLTNLRIRDPKKGVHVENLTEVTISSVDDAMQQLIKGAANQKAAAMKRASSRSHSIFTCIIESKWENQGIEHHHSARLNLVDLASSDIKESSGVEGKPLKEASNINKSLSTLGLVVMNLVKKSVHVPYRDSKLTFLLQDSLGGDSKILMIANISPSDCCASETLSTLKFAQHAKHIKKNLNTKRKGSNNAIVDEDASKDVPSMRPQTQQSKAIQNEDDIESLCTKLNVALEEKGHLERHFQELKIELEHAKLSPFIADQEAIAAASQREAEAHKMTASLAKENKDLKWQLEEMKKIGERNESALDDTSGKLSLVIEKLKDILCQRKCVVPTTRDFNQDSISLSEMVPKQLQEVFGLLNDFANEASTSTSHATAKYERDDSKKGQMFRRKGHKRKHLCKWLPHEEHALIKAVQKIGRGHWKEILNKYPDDFVGRTRTDLKDKWRNINEREKGRSKNK